MSEAEPLRQTGRTSVRWRGRTLTYFGGCDYFRLASHPGVLAAWRDGLKRLGGNVAASRVTTGNHPVFAELESALAEFFDVPAALFVPTGYMANAIAAQGLQGSFTRVLIDAEAHGSLQDAARQFRCLIQPFDRANPFDFSHAVDQHGAHDRPILLTEGVFGRNGKIAPLADYLRALPPHGVILLDDAHGAAVLGQHGRGTPEYAKVACDQMIQTITLSKAFGVYGGAILTTRALRKKIVETSVMFAGSTPLPPPLAYAALKAIKILRSQPGLRERLLSNTQHVKSTLLDRGFPVSRTPAPVISIEPSSSSKTKALRRRLLACGIYPSWIHYPGGPPGGAFRFGLSSEHTRSQLEQLLKALAGPD